MEWNGIEIDIPRTRALCVDVFTGLLAPDYVKRIPTVFRYTDTRRFRFAEHKYDATDSAADYRLVNLRRLISPETHCAEPGADEEIRAQCNYTINQVSWDNEDTVARRHTSHGAPKSRGFNKTLTRKEQAIKERRTKYTSHKVLCHCAAFPRRFCPH